MKFLKFFCALWVSIFLLACEFPWSKNDPVVVSVGSSKLFLSELQARFPEWNAWSDKQKLEYLNFWIDEETIFQEAQEHGVLDDSLLTFQIQQMARKMVVDHFLQMYTDTMIVSDAEKIDYYNNHKENYLRGKNMISGAVLYFKTGEAANAYYKAFKNTQFEALPEEHALVKNVLRFDSISTTPDSCFFKDFSEIQVGKLSPIKWCGGALKAIVVTERLDSLDVLPFAEVEDDVSNMAWLEHRTRVIDKLQKEWKNKRPIFSKTDIFRSKDK